MSDDLLKSATRALEKSGDDLLKSATRALEESGDAPLTTGELTRARLMRDLHRDKRRRASRTLFLVPAAATLLIATAAVAGSGGLSNAWRAVVSVVSGERIGGAEEPAAASTRPRAAAASPVTPATASSPTPPSGPTPESASTEPSGASATDNPSAGTPATADGPAAAASAGAQAPAPALATEAAVGTRNKTADPTTSGTNAQPDDAQSEQEALELSLYRKAHQAHFGAHDWTAALTAWDEYLRRAPRGRFAAEAQYNRGICLVRLGRAAEAEQALRPFAEGRYGQYRRDEAQRLIDAMRADASAGTPKPPTH